MENKILLINREQVHSLRDRLSESDNLPSCIEEVRKMAEIKSVLFWQADERSSCCGPGMPMHLYGELQTLERTLQKLEEGHIDEAIALLEDYESMILEIPVV
jgi:hypothetical protein